MKTFASCLLTIIAASVLVAACRTIFDRTIFPKAFKNDTAPAYAVLIAFALGLFAWSHWTLHIESIEGLGLTAKIDDVDSQVRMLRKQLTDFYKSRKVRTFDKSNWDQVRKLGRTEDGAVLLEITLDQEPIPETVQISEGVLLMPQDKYHFEGRNVRFPANSDKPDIGLTVMYYPKLEPSH